MASTYSNLKIELVGTGDQTGTWGDTTNDNFSIAFQEAITGSADVTFSSADVTVTLTDTNQAQTARNLRLNLTGTSGGARQLILGSGCQVEKLYLINNGLADVVTVKNTSGTGIAVPAGKTMFVYNNGTNVVEAVNASVTPFAVASGGTGLATLTANNVLIGNGTSNVAFVAPGTSGNLLTSNGTTWTSAASPFLSGMIVLWSGSIATIPAGFALCNGSNGTPDLRDRFVVGAGSTYAVNATGGSANATLPTHTHTATVTDPGHLHTYTRGGTDTVSGGGITIQTNSALPSQNTSTAFTGISVANSTEGSSATNANLPPYFALAYIMKL